MDDQKKCVWTGRKNTRVKAVTLKTLDRFSVPTERTFYVLPEHEQDLREFNKKFVDKGRYFLLLILGLSALLPIFALLSVIFSSTTSLVLPSVGIITSLIGVVIILFPFATPETIQWLGIKKALKVVRAAGFLLIVVGLVIGLLL